MITVIYSFAGSIFCGVIPAAKARGATDRVEPFHDARPNRVTGRSGASGSRAI